MKPSHALTLATAMLFIGFGCKSSQLSRTDQTITKTAGGAIVEVEFFEQKIHMPAVIPHGNITFRITNPSHNDHNFKISGNGIEQQLPHDLQEGQTTDYTVNLVPGTYRVICPLIGHPDLGERLELTVTP